MLISLKICFFALLFMWKKIKEKKQYIYFLILFGLFSLNSCRISFSNAIFIIFLFIIIMIFFYSLNSWLIFYLKDARKFIAIYYCNFVWDGMQIQTEKQSRQTRTHFKILSLTIMWVIITFLYRFFSPR